MAVFYCHSLRLGPASAVGVNDLTVTLEVVK